MGRVRRESPHNTQQQLPAWGSSVDERNQKNDESYFEVKREERRVRTVMIFHSVFVTKLQCAAMLPKCAMPKLHKNASPR